MCTVCLSVHYSLSPVHAVISSELITDKAGLRPEGKVLKATMRRQNVCIVASERKVMWSASLVQMCSMCNCNLFFNEKQFDKCNYISYGLVGVFVLGNIVC